MDVYIGIDVACAKKKFLPLVICYRGAGRLFPLPLADYNIKPPRGLGNALTLHDKVNHAFANDVADYIETVCDDFHLNPVRIGIDSPLRPRDNHLKRRAAEQALDKARINCYTTPSVDDFKIIKAKGMAHLEAGKPIQNIPNAHQIFMMLGFALNERLSKIAHCIEVYPHATVKQLGVADIHKSKGNQAQLQLAAIANYTGWPRTPDDWQQANNICLGPMHDKVDAYSAAWVASLPEQERFCFGDADKDDAIWIPKVAPAQAPTLSSQKKNISALSKLNVKQHHQTPVDEIPNKAKTNANNLSADTDHQRSCPACDQHLFKRWPFGWDAHAAHRCTGLNEVGQEARKREFKQRFMGK